LNVDQHHRVPNRLRTGDVERPAEGIRCRLRAAQGLRQLPGEGSKYSKTAKDQVAALAAALKWRDRAGREERMCSQL
jgi:hypothetical protein